MDVLVCLCMPVCDSPAESSGAWGAPHGDGQEPAENRQDSLEGSGSQSPRRTLISLPASPLPAGMAWLAPGNLQSLETVVAGGGGWCMYCSPVLEIPIFGREGCGEPTQGSVGPWALGDGDWLSTRCLSKDGPEAVAIHTLPTYASYIRTYTKLNQPDRLCPVFPLNEVDRLTDGAARVGASSPLPTPRWQPASRWSRWRIGERSHTRHTGHRSVRYA